MTLALAYGFFVSCPDGFNVDTSDPDVMKQFLGNNTDSFYLSSTNFAKFHKIKNKLKPILFVTTYNRDEHNFEHFMVVTESIIDGFRLGKNIRQPALPDNVIVVQTIELKNKMWGITGKSCQVDDDPHWMILSSDD